MKRFIDLARKNPRTTAGAIVALLSKALSVIENPRLLLDQNTWLIAILAACFLFAKDAEEEEEGQEEPISDAISLYAIGFPAPKADDAE